MLTAIARYSGTVQVESDDVRIVASINQRPIASRAFGVRVMLLASDAESAAARSLTGFGSQVECEADFFTAMSHIIDDPLGYDLFVMDCDGFGGMAAGERAVATLIASDARMRVILISAEFDAPAYPMGRRTAVCLPSPVSHESLRFGFDHVLRDRPVMHLS